MEAPDPRKFVAGCSDLAATDRVMERRAAARKRVLTSGVVELRESALRCKIVDLSDTGAGLALLGASHVPNFFTLLIPDRVPVFCQIIWRRQERLGVTFRELRVL
jgi:PilZ domain